MKLFFTRNTVPRRDACGPARKLLLRAQCCLLLFALSAFSTGAAGQHVVTGTVKDEAGTALPGVSVNLKGTQTGTLTDERGKYRIQCPDLQGALVFTSIGFSKEEVPLNGRSEVNVSMTTANKALNEIVVTGYSSQKKKDITGSVAVVDIKSLKSIPAGSAMQALQGQAPGVNVISSGVPGAESKVMIRGIGTFGSTQPLVLVDGVQADLNNVSAEDIESMQVLKDAGAASIYGVRGANGVIIITTKKGKTGAPVFTYDSYYGVTFPFSGNPLNQLNSEDFARLTRQAFPNSTLFANGLPDYLYAGPGGAGTGMEGDAAVNPSKYNLDPVNSANNYLIQRVDKTGTDWYHAMFKRAPMTSHNITASGGTEKAAYLFSLGYLNQQGPVIQSYLKRYAARINTSFKLRDNIRIGENAYVFYKQNPGFDNQGQFSPMANLYKMMPVVPVYDIMGNFGGTFAGPELGSDANPVATQYRKENNRANEWDITGNVYAEVDVLKKVTVRTSFGGTIRNLYNQSFNFVAYNDKQGYNLPNSYSEGASYNSSSIWTNTLAYRNAFGKHQLDVLAGTEAIRNYGRGVSGGSQKLFSTDFDYLILGNGTTNITNSSSAYINTLFSLFGRLNYTYNDKYLLSATLRRDGSSRFGSEKRYGVFPSVSLGWRVSQESFLKGISWINDLKLRASWGMLGSENNVAPENAYSLYGGNFGSSYYDITGSSNSIKQGFFQTRIGNPQTGWEQDIITNAGFDASILDNKLDLSVEYYKKSVKGLLFAKALPATAGGATPPTVNVGDIQNTGVDIGASFRQEIGNRLRLNIGASITTYRNTVVDIPAPGYFDAGAQQQLGNMVRNQEGHPVSAYYGYQVMHLFKDDAEVAAAPQQAGAAPGRFRYVDQDGNKKIDAADRTFLGSPNPDFTYGVNLGLNYGNLDLGATLYGSQGSQIVNTIKVNTHFFGTYVGGKSRDLLRAWTPENTGTDIPKVESTNSFSTAGTLNSFFVENGSYLRLRSLVLGYALPAALLKRFSIQKFRVYCQATNLFTITKYTGLDPELGGSSSSFGIDYGNYPNNQKTVLLGVNLSF